METLESHNNTTQTRKVLQIVKNALFTSEQLYQFSKMNCQKN